MKLVDATDFFEQKERIIQWILFLSVQVNATRPNLINSISRLMLYSHRIDRYSLEEQC